METNVLAIGDNVVDRYLDLGAFYPGGNAVNVAVHARRCDVAAAYIGAVGTDRAGRAVLAALRAEGVDTTGVRVVDGPNASAEVRVVDGNRAFGRGDAGVSRFRLDQGDLAAASAAAIVHTGECSMLEDQLPRLRGSARRLSFDFSERPLDYVTAYAPLVDVAVRSCPGATREEAVHAAWHLRSLGPQVVAVTLGAAGAVVLVGEEVAWATAPKAPVVDTLGAGDAFIARLLTGLLSDEPVASLVGAATAYASASCASYGAFGHETDEHDRDDEKATQQPDHPVSGDRATLLDPIHKGVDLR